MQLHNQHSMWWLFFSPSGQIGRQAYVLGVLFWVMILGFVIQRLVVTPEESGTFLMYSFLFLFACFLSLISSVMLSVKRLHNLGISGPFAILLLVPPISFVTFIALCAIPTRHGGQ